MVAVVQEVRTLKRKECSSRRVGWPSFFCFISTDYLLGGIYFSHFWLIVTKWNTMIYNLRINLKYSKSTVPSFPTSLLAFTFSFVFCDKYALLVCPNNWWENGGIHAMFQVYTHVAWPWHVPYLLHMLNHIILTYTHYIENFTRVLGSTN